MISLAFRTCNKCNEKKEISEFGLSSRDGFGHKKSCKKCRREEAKEYRNKNKEKIKERRKIPKHIRKKEDRPRAAAQANLLYHLKKGTIKKGNKCEACGSDKNIEAHHYDYNKPLDVFWICRECHTRVHVIVKRYFYDMPEQKINTRYNINLREENNILEKDNKKRCSKCKTIKDINNFGIYLNDKLGTRPVCKKCRSKKNLTGGSHAIRPNEGSYKQTQGRAETKGSLLCDRQQ